MKCPACWAEKAFVRPVSGWKAVLHKSCFFVPLKCHHCYYKFSAFWPLTVGQQLTPPTLRVRPATTSVEHEPSQRPVAAPVQAGRRRAA